MPVGNLINRALRAAKQGYKTDMPLYHGTNADITEFSLDQGGKVSGSRVGKLGVSLATDPKTASEFARLAGDEGANVIKAYHRASKPARIELDGTELNHEIAATVKQAWDDGFDAIKFDNYTTPGGETGRSFVLVRNPNQIRSVNANFDPKKIKSASITAGAAGLGIGTLLDPEQAMAADKTQSNIARFQEIANRGLQDKLDPDKRARFDEAVRRGLITHDPQLATDEPQTPEGRNLYQRFQDWQKRTGRRLFGTDGKQGAIDQALMSNPVTRAGAEAGAGIGRSLSGFFDSVVTYPVNETIRLAGGEDQFFEGVENYLNRTIGMDQPFMKTEGLEGAARVYVVKPASELAPAAVGGGGVARQIAQRIPQATAMAPTTTAQNVVRTMGASTPAQDVVGGSLAGVGAEIGEEVDKSLGGSGQIGGIAGAIATPTAVMSLPLLAKTTVKGAIKEAAPTVDVLKQEAQLPRPRAQVDEVPVETNQLPRHDIRQAISEGRREAAGYTLSPNGRIIVDPVQVRALDNGFDPRVVVRVHQMNPATKRIGQRMLNQADQYLSGASGARHPTAALGSPVADRFNVVLRENRKAMAQQRQAIKKLSGQRIDSADIIDTFDDAMNQLGVERVFTKNGIRFRFGKDSPMEGRPAIKHFQWLNNKFQGRMTGQKLQDIKDYLDGEINWGQDPLNQKKLDRRSIKLLKDIRAGVDKKLRDASTDYATANDKLSETIRVMNDFGDTMGRRFDPDSDMVSEYIGQNLRKMESNYGVGPGMKEAIENLDAAAAKYGTVFNDDIVALTELYSGLERRLGSFKPNSFQGRSESAASSLASAGANFAAGNLGSAAMEGARGGIKLYRGRHATSRAARERVEEQNKAIRAMYELLRSQ